MPGTSIDCPISEYHQHMLIYCGDFVKASSLLMDMREPSTRDGRFSGKDNPSLSVCPSATRVALVDLA